MFNLSDRFLDFYSSYLNSHFKSDKEIKNELKEKGSFIIRSNSQNYQMVLIFLDKEERLKSVSFTRVDRDKIKTSSGENYDSINKILNYYELKNLVQQKQCFFDLVDDLKRQATVNGRLLSDNIKYCGINTETEEGQTALIEIAKCAAAQQNSGISDFIKNYGINGETEEGQTALIEIAKLAAQQSGTGTSVYIQDYGIDANTQQGKTALIEIAKLAAQQNGRTSAYIQNYGINAATPEGQTALIEIAKLAAQQQGGITSGYIQNYCIDAKTQQGQEALIEIAKLAAKQHGWGTSQSIQKYGIDTETQEGKTALIEIAKLAAQQNGEKTSLYIQNFGIDAKTQEGKAALIEIAKLAAKQNGGGASQYIQKYGIDAKAQEGQTTLIEIAKLAAQQDGRGTSRWIKKYDIDATTQEGQTALIEIAKLASYQNGEGTSLWLERYGIDAKTQQGQTALIKIAKLAAQQDGLGTWAHIGNYHIDAETPEGKVVFIEFAKLAAYQDGEVTAEIIQSYHIDDEATLIKIANIAHLNTPVSLTNLKNFNINKTAAKQMVLLAFSSTKKKDIDDLLLRLQSGVIYLKEEYNADPWIYSLINELTAHVPLFKQFLFREEIQNSPQEVLKEFEVYSDKTYPSLKPFLNHASNACDELEKSERTDKKWIQQKLVLFAGLTFLQLSLLEDQRVKTDGAQALLQQVIDVQDSSLRTQLAHQVLEHHSLANLYHEKLKSFPNYAWLPMFLLITLSNATAAEKIPRYFHVLNHRRSGEIFPLKDAHFNKSVLKGLTALLEDQIVDQQIKWALIDNLVLHESANKENLKNAFKILKGLIEMKEQRRMQTWTPVLNPYDFLNTQYQEAFKNLIPLPDDLCQTERIGAFLEKLRDPTLILRYAANLKTLPEAEAHILLALLGKGMGDQMRGCSSRYEKSPHLNQVFKQEGLKEKWTQTQEVDLKQLLSSPSATQALDFTKLIQSSFDNRHAKSIDYPELIAYLESKTHLEVKTKEEKGSFKAGTGSQEVKDKKLRDFQKALIQLCETQSAKSLSKALACFPSKDHPAYSSQFHDDLEAWEKSLKELKRESAPLKAIESDDFFDLMACGTEVAGSCQNVDGDASLNKCLLAYVLDGKNRLLTLKNEQGVIQARAILRILIDRTTRKPVLFMERVYPVIAKPEWREGLIALAKSKASSLNLPLLSQERVGQVRPYPHTVESIGSPAPFEYVDAVSGIAVDGQFAIQGAFEFTS